MYYITRHGASLPLGRFRGCQCVCRPDGLTYHAVLTAICSPLLSRLFGPSTRTPGFGWQPVATDGDVDEIEMAEGR